LHGDFYSTKLIELLLTGKLYLEKCEEPDLKRAGDCFYLGRCFDMAAQVYARGCFFSDCLNVCAKGGLFDIGLHYVQH